MENLRWYFGDFAAWMKGGEGKYQSLLEEGTAESDSRDIFGYLFVGHLLLVSAPPHAERLRTVVNAGLRRENKTI